MSRSDLRPKALALLACSALLMTSLGCNPGNVTAPQSTAEVVTNPNFIRILSTSKGVTDLSRTSGASKVISAERGGTLTQGRVTLEFPAHAVDFDTEITIELTGDGTLGVELGPHGIQFNRPVTMTLDLEGTSAEGNASASSTLWYNEELDRWERVRAADGSDENRLRSELDHFSKYNGGVGG